MPSQPKTRQPTVEEIKRATLFVPCETKEHLHRWVKVYLGLDFPDSIICDDDTQNPSNSSPMDLLWEIYSKAIKGNDPNFSQVLGYASRDSMKTLMASILELLFLFHIDGDVCHLASIEAQAKKSQEYVESYFRKSILREFLTAKNRRTITMTYYVNNKNKSVISPIQYEPLPQSEKDNYTEKHNSIKILVCNMNSVNGEHPQLLSIDESDLAPVEPVEEAKLCATVKNGKLPVIFMTSTRKSAVGPVQKEIDNAADSGLLVRHWNIIDVTEACPPSRHKPEEPKINLYYSEESLRTISEEEYTNLVEQEQNKYVKAEGYAGCAKCPLFAMCKGRLATKQKSKSHLLKPIDHVISTFRKVSIERAKAQLLCWKPASEGLIFPSFSREVHMLTPEQMIARITGEYPGREFNKEELVKEFKHMGAEFYSGMDFGFTHNFATTTAALLGHTLYVFDVIAKAGLELMDKIDLCKTKIAHLNPKIYPDNAYPADISTFRRNGFRMANFRKDVDAGIEAVRTRLRPGPGMPPTIFFLKDDDGCELLAKRISQYSFKTDAQGEFTEEPNPHDDDELDSLRYLCQNIPVNKGTPVVLNLGAKPANPIYPKDPNANWIKNKVSELIEEDPFDDSGSVQGSGKINFIF